MADLLVSDLEDHGVTKRWRDMGDGTFAEIEVSVAKPSAGIAPSNAAVSAYAASLQVKAIAGTLWGIAGYNSGPAQFLQLHDASSLPANGAAPVLTLILPATSNFSFDFGDYGMAFGVGLVLCNSTTGPTKTIGAADCWFHARYS